MIKHHLFIYLFTVQTLDWLEIYYCGQTLPYHLIFFHHIIIKNTNLNHYVTAACHSLSLLILQIVSAAAVMYIMSLSSCLCTTYIMSHGTMFISWSTTAMISVMFHSSCHCHVITVIRRIIYVLWSATYVCHVTLIYNVTVR